MDKIVLIPAYKPDEKLITLTCELAEYGLGIVVVDDGSGAPYEHIFEKVAQNAEVIRIFCNSGKGNALKSGMISIIENHPECKGIVTADSDGQHKAEDILRVFKELDAGSQFVLTVRNFEQDMPFRSKLGNKLSKYIYTLLNGHYFADNQSGLRGFSSEQLEWLVRVDGNKYDYEMNMLFYADKQGITITTLPIDAIYIDNNSSSHFHPIKDTLRIYARLFHSARMTFFALLIVQQLLILVTVFFNYNFLYITIPTIGATETVFKIVMNKFIVFRKFRYRDLMRTVIHAIIRYMAYSLGIIMFYMVLEVVPLIFAYDITAILVIPLEYMLYKFTYIAKYPDINKEK